jgi:hypothetical protein
MNLRSLALLALVVTAAKADVQFSGYFVTPEGQLFTLSDPDRDQTSIWLKVGDSFDGFTLRAFDRSREFVTVESNGVKRNLPLREAKVKSDRIAVRGTMKFGKEGPVEGVEAAFALGQEAEFAVRPGLVLRLTVKRLPDGNLRYISNYVATDAAGREHIETLPWVIAAPGTSFSLAINDLEFSFTP